VGPHLTHFEHAGKNIIKIFCFVFVQREDAHRLKVEIEEWRRRALKA